MITITSETGCHEGRRAYYLAHFLHINKDDLDKKHERPYNRENTASRSICEVKHVLVWIVVRWGTTREVQMLFFFNFFRHFFLACTSQVKYCRIDTEPTRLGPGVTRAAPNQDNSQALFFGETTVILTSTDACDG